MAEYASKTFENRSEFNAVIKRCSVGLHFWTTRYVIVPCQA